MKRIAYAALLLVVSVAVGFMLGPVPPEPNLDPTPATNTIQIDSLDAWIEQHERGFKTLKPNNEADIEWYNDSVSVTEYSIVYLHGFTASKEEGNPVHRSFAKRYGCNLYLTRLYGHGLDTTEPLLTLTPENYLRSAKEAVAIGKTIGKKVILMCTSTGATLGLYMAAHDPAITSVICYSPNIDIYDPNSHYLTKPWGLQMVRLAMGSNYREYEAIDEFKKYWQTKYRIEGLVSVRTLINHTMILEIFKKITQPVFVGAYYKDEEHQDKVVSVVAMKNMMPQLGTVENQKRFVAFPNAGEHVITNTIKAKDVESVSMATNDFAEQVLGMKPIDKKAPPNWQGF
ncbi:MAG: alpha/beta hydrolase [Flavobacteriales bacterium]|nr:alpha/beta hydrolase [Flavobacteriales bacterium]